MLYKACCTVGFSKSQCLLPCGGGGVAQPEAEVSSLLFTWITHVCVCVSAHTHTHTPTCISTHPPSCVQSCPLGAPHPSFPITSCCVILPVSSPALDTTVPTWRPPGLLSLPCLPTILGSRQMCSSPPSSPVTLWPCLAAGFTIRLVYNAL